MGNKISNVRIHNKGAGGYTITYEPVIPGKYIVAEKSFNYLYEMHKWLMEQEISVGG